MNHFNVIGWLNIISSVICFMVGLIGGSQEPGISIIYIIVGLCGIITSFVWFGMAALLESVRNISERVDASSDKISSTLKIVDKHLCSGLQYICDNITSNSND